MSNQQQDQGPKRAPVEQNEPKEPTIDSKAEGAQGPDPKMEEKPKEKEAASLKEDVKARAGAMVELVKQGFGKLKDYTVGGFKAVGNFFRGIWDMLVSFMKRTKDFVLSFGDKDSVRDYAGYAKMGFLGVAIASLGWITGAYLVGMYGLANVAMVSATAGLFCVAVERTVDHYKNKEIEAKAQESQAPAQQAAS